MSLRVPLRWEDVDGLGHVGHVAVLSLLEEGRDAFFAPFGIGRYDYVVGRCEVTYRRELLLDLGHVVVACEVARLGTASLTTSERLTDDAGEVYVEAAFSVVLWDHDKRASRPITLAERAALAPTAETTA